MTDHHDPRTWHWPLGMPESLANTKARMAVKTLNIRHNADGTLTIKANNYTESIEIQGKTTPELLEAVRWALVCAHFEWTDSVEELVRSELKLIVRK